MNQQEFDFKGADKSHPIFSDLAPHIVEKFFQYHADNPTLYGLFERFALELHAAGRDYFGIGAIAERIRWYTVVETKGDDFKIGNNHRSCYARLLMIRRPELRGFFRTRSTPGTVEGDY